MGWEKRLFKKKQTVWAMVDDAGQLVIDQGRVPIRYKDDEEAKVYNAGVDNLTTDGDTVEQKKSKRKTKKKSLTKEDIATFDEEIWRKPEGPLVSTSTSRAKTDISAPPLKAAMIYTDGACSNNPGPCGAGLVIVTAETIRDLFQFIGLGTNNIGELYAIKIALDECPDVEKLQIFTDSNYCIGILDKGWKAKANKALVTEIKSQIKELDTTVEFIKVRGHSGDELNDRADELAVRSTEKTQKK